MRPAEHILTGNARSRRPAGDVRESCYRCYALGLGLTFVNRWLSIAIYVIVALTWLIPDRRVERTLAAAVGRSAEAPPQT